MSRLKDLAAWVGTPIVAGGIGYADLQQSKRSLEKEREEREENKNADKIEEMKRKEEPSGGGGSESTARPKFHKKGGSVKSSASKRADGCAVRGKTRGKMVTMCGGGYAKGKK